MRVIIHMKNFISLEMTSKKHLKGITLQGLIWDIFKMMTRLIEYPLFCFINKIFEEGKTMHGNITQTFAVNNGEL